MDAMEEEATQPSTQLMLDPRRLGEYDSDLSEEDLGDILCIFHPASLSAIHVAARITDAAPEHTVSRADIPLRIRGMEPGQQIISPDTMDLAEEGLVTRDLALRLSATLKDPLAGYTFGRNEARCDFVLSHKASEGAKRISNIHFRVWVTEQGVIMLEDQSTNGTWVEGKHLRAKSREPGHTARHTLTHGTLIKLQMIPGQDDDIQFVVRIPKREGIADELWDKNMHAYFQRLDMARWERERQRAADQNGDGAANGGAPDLFANQNNAVVTTSRSLISSRPKEWTGGRKYNKQHVIGKGAFATVYLLTDKYTGDQYAAKEIEKRKFMKNGVIDAKIDQEMGIMESIHHDNIVKFVECVDWVDHLYIIMEFAPEGTLGALIDDIGPLAEQDTKVVASQMLDALKYLHDKGIAHRDIKPDNVLVKTRPPHLHVQLTDFGLSKKILPDEDTFLRTFCGTILYCAPEVYPEYLDYFDDKPAGARERVKQDKKAKRYDDAVDIWSLAGLLFYCLTKLPPYIADASRTYHDMLRQIMTGPLDIRPLQKMNVTEWGINFLKVMLNNMPQLRATIPELLDHPWLTGLDPNVEESIETEDTDIVGGRQPYRGMPGESFHLDTQMTDVGDLDDSKASFDSNKADAENVDPLAESGLEQSASQLSIVEAGGFEDESLDTSDEVDLVHDTTTPNRAGRIEIPNSITSDSFVSFDEQFLPQQTSPQQPRLFGELNVHDAALDYPFNDLTNVRTAPISINSLKTTRIPRLRHDNNKLAMSENKSDVLDASPRHLRGGASVSVSVSPNQTDESAAFASANMSSVAAFASANTSSVADSSNADSSISAKTGGVSDSSDTLAGAGRAPSLLGAESMVGDMAISSPGQGVSGYFVGKASRSSLHGPSIISIANASATASLRRPREADEDDEDDENGRPAAKRHHSVVADVDGFQPPRRILAKLVSTPDSVIQKNITITITEVLTTWGRGFKNTHRYEIRTEDRVPKNALKIIFWGPGAKPGDPVPAGKDNDHAFYIATKATHGIKVNNVPVVAHEPAEPQKAPAMYWGKLHHGDIIVAWSHALNTKSVVKFRFDCFWGASAKPRQPGGFFDIVESGATRDSLNRFCQWEESRVLKAKYEVDMHEKAIRDEEGAADGERESADVTPGPSASSSHTDDGGRGLEDISKGLSFSQ